MKKLSQKLTCLLLSGAVGVSTLFGGCSKKSGGSDDPNVLDIYLLYKGYQDEWLTALIDMFKEEEWVKEKYPNLEITYTYDAVQATAGSKLTGGSSMNKYDLLFSVLLNAYEGKLLADLTDSVYLAEVPGEPGVKVKEKIPDYILDIANWSDAPTRADGSDSYYYTIYVEGMYGMLYNADILRTLNLNVPVTTDEFIKCCEDIEAKGYTYKDASGTEKTTNASIINASENNYWQRSFDAWWSQYEGKDEYINFYKGIDSELMKRSSSVLKQQGRLESLKVIESIFQGGHGYKYAHEEDYMGAQSSFCMGIGAFHFNGDYFASEMKATIQSYKEEGIECDIKYMKLPVISAIVKKLDYRTMNDEYMSDAMLANIIREIDENILYENSAYKTQVSRADFDKIAEARRIVGYSSASTQTVGIPSYSPAKELASDFLRFMYTDKAIVEFARASGGVTLPTTYDYAANSDVYSQFNRIQKSKYEINQLTKGTNYETLRLPNALSFPLGKAGLDALTRYTGKFEVDFTVKTANRTTAEKIYQNEIDYWDEATWTQLCSAAGY